jgi:hypothetical protein
MLLSELGWTSYFAACWEVSRKPAWTPARVISQQRGLWRVAGEFAECERAFADIEELAAQCRYRDCGHTTEPGCAVQAAIAEGRLDADRLENRRKLEREQAFLQRKIDPDARQEHNERTKLLHRGARQKYEQRRRDGGKS